METLDLRSKQCPMSLVTLKRHLLHEHHSDKSLHLLFSSEPAMQDIIRYLDKKSYLYSINRSDSQVSLIMQIKAQKSN
ncbi:sulfurtransferase TusA family protein [Psychromonas aquimarina]|uniref:sulfurtransferase TusA family protein n=1 Tax=Psychromonas aquimarina TaxID=444919 RepID=UPI0009FFF4C6|nr:sulfurtransferase TusA family protein [Psychromonas aquimarina]